MGNAVVDSPLGPLWIAAGRQGVALIHFGRRPEPRALARLARLGIATGAARARSVPPVARELAEYFAGRRRRFGIPVDLRGLTTFQRRVLRATSRIPYGEVATYRAIAISAGSPNAARAVGSALRANPVPLLVPCHRVVGSDGSLGGYSGGRRQKRALLALEGTAGEPAGGS